MWQRWPCVVKGGMRGKGDMCGEGGACMVKVGGGMHGKGGVCVVKGGLHGKGHA